MYKIGDTSGHCNVTCDEKKHTIKVVGDIVDKLAKKCEDVPAKMTAPAKVIEVTNGCYASTQVIEVSDEFAASSDSGEAGEGASTGGGCGGGRTPIQPVCPSSSGCGKKSSCGGSPTKNKDPCSGQKLTDLVVPQTIEDFLTSDYSDLLAAEQLSESAFQQSFCARQPYPECATCPYNSNRLMTQTRDLGAIFRQMDNAIQTMLQGNYALATNMFKCPGLMRMLMTGDIRTMAEVAVPNAITAMIDVVAARGALDAFKGIATAAEYTDFRAAVMGSAGALLAAGGMVGIPRAFVDEVGLILETIGCDPHTLVRFRSIGLGPRDTRYGPTYSLCGDRGYDRNRPYVQYKSDSRLCASPINAKRAETAINKVKPSLKAAAENSVVPPEKPKYATDSQFVPAKESVVEESKTYYRESPETGKIVPIQTKVGTPIDELEAIHGTIFVKNETGIDNQVAIPTTDKVATSGKVYLYEDPVTEQKVPLPISTGEKIEDAVDKLISDKHMEPGSIVVYEKPSTIPPVKTVPTVDTTVVVGKVYIDENHNVIPVSPGTPIVNGSVTVAGKPVKVFENVKSDITESFVKVDETKPIPGKEYFTVNEYGTYEQLDVEDLQSFEVPVYSKLVSPKGSDVGTSEYIGNDVCILDDGLVIEEPVFLDAASYIMAIDTKSLVTKTGTKAGEMASIKGIGLSAYEIKMAYMLDNLNNGSVLPDDVTGEVIPTILDTISDDY